MKIMELDNNALDTILRGFGGNIHPSFDYARLTESEFSNLCNECERELLRRENNSDFANELEDGLRDALGIIREL